MAYSLDRSFGLWEELSRFFRPYQKFWVSKVREIRSIVAFLNSFLTFFLDHFIQSFDAYLLRKFTVPTVTLLSLVYLWEVLQFMLPFVPTVAFPIVFGVTVWSLFLVKEIHRSVYIPPKKALGIQEEPFTLGEWMVFLGAWGIGFLLGSFYAEVSLQLLAGLGLAISGYMRYVLSAFVISCAVIEEVVAGHGLLLARPKPTKDVQDLPAPLWHCAPALLFSPMLETLVLAVSFPMAPSMLAFFYLVTFTHYLAQSYQLYFSRDTTLYPQATNFLALLHRSMQSLSDFVWLGTFAPLSSNRVLRACVLCTTFSYRYFCDAKVMSLVSESYHKSRPSVHPALPIQHFLTWVDTCVSDRDLKRPAP